MTDDHVLEPIAVDVVDALRAVDDLLDLAELLRQHIAEPSQTPDVGKLFGVLVGIAVDESFRRNALDDGPRPPAGYAVLRRVRALTDANVFGGAAACAEVDGLPRDLERFWSALTALLGAEKRRRTREVALLRRTWQADTVTGWWGSPDDVP